MVTNLRKEKALLMFKLAKRKGGCWGGKYERLEYFKRFEPNLNELIKNLANKGLIIIHKKPKYTAISLNNHHKKEIIEFIEKEFPDLKAMIK